MNSFFFFKGHKAKVDRQYLVNCKKNFLKMRQLQHSPINAGSKLETEKAGKQRAVTHGSHHAVLGDPGNTHEGQKSIFDHHKPEKDTPYKPSCCS